MLQADFLLTANREDISSSPSWNKILLDNIPLALLGAIKEFNAGEFRYSWPCYLALRPDIVDFFQDVQSKTLRLLSKQPVLESLAGDLMAPSDLIYIPEQFTNADGKLLIPTRNMKLNYLSHKYSSNDCHVLEHLGIRSLSAENFLDDLEHFISNNPSGFQEMPHTWHSWLSKILTSLIVANGDHERFISHLPIIPLHAGQWVRPCERNLLFSLPSKNMVIPNGLHVFQVHPDAENDIYRRQLLMVLGVKESTVGNICDIILKTHEHDQSRCRTISTTDLMTHAVFLYKAKYNSARGIDLWLVTEQESYCRSSQVYMDSEVPYSASSMFGENRSRFHFLNDGYWKDFSAPDWRTWLTKNLNIAVIPRLVVPPTTLQGPFNLANDFQFLIESCPSSELLLLLRHHWNHYSRWVVTEVFRTYKPSKESSAWKESQEKLRATLSSMKVKCHSGVTAKLCQTFLHCSSMPPEDATFTPESRDDLTTAGTNLVKALANSSPTSGLSSSNHVSMRNGVASRMGGSSSDGSVIRQDQKLLPAGRIEIENSSYALLLDVPEPDNDQWDYLKHFGVVIKVEATYLISSLRRLKSTQTSIEHVSRLYGRMHAWALQNDANIIMY